jgi:predicted phosphodiesterase
MAYRITDKKRQQIIKSLLAGKSYSQIRELYSVSNWYITSLRRELGITRDSKKAKTVEMKRRDHFEDAKSIIAILSERDTRLKFKELSKKAGLTAEELELCMPIARKIRPDLMFGKFDNKYWLSNTPTWYSNQTDLSTILPLAGEIGIVTDTHLCSVAERLDVLEMAYDTFAKRGIKTVLHIGDVSDGWKEYRNHINFVKIHGDQDQAKYVVEKYPKRDGITTYAIGGNHDDSYGASKIDRLSLIVHGFQHNGKHVEGRRDIVYLGQYSHYIIMPQEVRIHLLHPRGNNAYALSYKQQKRAESFPKNERPDLQLSGHFHTYCHIVHDQTHMIACPGMQDETEFFKRLGFARSIGFMVLEYAIDKGRFTHLAPKVTMCG